MQIPNTGKWIAECRLVKDLGKELNQARNLVEAFYVLGRLLGVVDRLNELCSFPIGSSAGKHLTERECKVILAKYVEEHEMSLLKQRFEMRANYGQVREHILKFAKKHAKFTVDDLVSSPTPDHIPRRVWSANLYSLATKGDKPLRRVKAGTRGRGSESPAVYALRER